MLFSKRMAAAYRHAKLGYDLGHTENINADIPTALSDMDLTPDQLTIMRAAPYHPSVSVTQVKSSRSQAGFRKLRDVGVQVQDAQMQESIDASLSTAMFNSPSRLPSAAKGKSGPLGTTSWAVDVAEGE